MLAATRSPASRAPGRASARRTCARTRPASRARRRSADPSDQSTHSQGLLGCPQVGSLPSRHELRRDSHTAPLAGEDRSARGRGRRRESTRRRPRGRGRQRAVESGAVTCVLTPELTEGPYYLAGEKQRRNISDGHPGTLLLLHLRVLTHRRANHCAAPLSTSGMRMRPASTRVSARERRAGRSCAGSRRPTPTASRCSRRSIPVGIRGVRCTSTSRCTLAATSCIPGSSSSPMR